MLMNNINKNTFNAILNYFNPRYIQLVYGDHLISIDTEGNGSFALIRTFKYTIFSEYEYNKETDLLICKY